MYCIYYYYYHHHHHHILIELDLKLLVLPKENDDLRNKKVICLWTFLGFSCSVLGEWSWKSFK